MKRSSLAAALEAVPLAAPSAQAGKRVLIIEREHFPRFHIGESLIPYANEEFRAIGVWEKLEKAGFMPKLGAEFVLGNSRATTRVLFARYLPSRLCRYVPSRALPL